MSLPDKNPKTIFGQAKPGIHAIPPVALLHCGRGMEDGERKYGLTNWREHEVSASVYYDPMFRHMAAWWDGEQVAPDSGVHHLGHVMACCAILLDAEAMGQLNDDRPTIPGPFARMVAEMTRPMDDGDDDDFGVSTLKSYFNQKHVEKSVPQVCSAKQLMYAAGSYLLGKDLGYSAVSPAPQTTQDARKDRVRVYLDRTGHKKVSLVPEDERQNLIFHIARWIEQERRAVADEFDPWADDDIRPEDFGDALGEPVDWDEPEDEIGDADEDPTFEADIEEVALRVFSSSNLDEIKDVIRAFMLDEFEDDEPEDAEIAVGFQSPEGEVFAVTLRTDITFSEMETLIREFLSPHGERKQMAQFNGFRSHIGTFQVAGYSQNNRTRLAFYIDAANTGLPFGVYELDEALRTAGFEFGSVG